MSQPRKIYGLPGLWAYQQGAWRRVDLINNPMAPIDPDGKIGSYLDPDLWGDSDESLCNHSWKRYCGIIEEYDYCEKCDEKRKV